MLFVTEMGRLEDASALLPNCSLLVKAQHFPDKWHMWRARFCPHRFSVKDVNPQNQSTYRYLEKQCFLTAGHKTDVKPKDTNYVKEREFV